MNAHKKVGIVIVCNIGNFFKFKELVGISRIFNVHALREENVVNLVCDGEVDVLFRKLDYAVFVFSD